MLDISQVVSWLRESDDEAAADIAKQCSLTWLYVDTLFELGSERETELFDLNIEAPARILSANDPASLEVYKRISNAIQEMSPAVGCHIREVYWVPRIPSPVSQAESEISEKLAVVDSRHVGDAWKKALERKSSDPDGAITAARSLLEAVSKHILDKNGKTYSGSDKFNKLLHQALESLSLAPAQQSSDLLRGFMGSCENVVNQIATIRNRMGDAHGKGHAGEVPTALHAELAVNIAGAMATFLINSWESQIKGKPSQ